MKRRVETWTVNRLQKERNSITFPEYQREKSLWPPDKKAMLIDSILADIDIPKLYFNRLRDGTIEVVDGQQRLWSIWEYVDDVYPYQLNGRKLKFSELSAAQRRTILDYTFQVTVFDEADDEYLRELFVRLQLGLLLNTGERLNAATGKMKNFVFGAFSNHRFIKRLGIPDRRFAKETLCAQICINSFSLEKTKQFSRTRYEDISSFFSEYAEPKGKNLTIFQSQTRYIMNNADILWRAFGNEARDLKNRSYILSVYLFVEQHGLEDGESRIFVDFVFTLWKRLREEARLGMDRENRELYSFQSLLSSAPGEAYQIQGRHEKLLEYYQYYKVRRKIKGD